MSATWSISSANTSAPVVSNANYSFVSGDVGNWFFIKSGASATPGWYQIASVATGAATLTAGVGTATNTSGQLNTAVGCGTASSLTSITGTVDYSLSASALAVTGLTTASASATIAYTGATVAMIGNGIQITGGTLFLTGIYNISSVSAGVSITVDRAATSGIGAAGTANIGGSLATPTKMLGVAIGSNAMYLQYESSPYQISSAPTINPASVTPGGSATPYTQLTGCYAVRGDNGTLGRPTIQATASITYMLTLTNGWLVQNIIFDGNSESSTTAMELNAYTIVRNCYFKNFKNYGLYNIGADTSILGCEFYNITSVSINSSTASTSMKVQNCYVHDGANNGIVLNAAGSCAISNIVANQTTSNGHGIQASTYAPTILNNSVYGCGADGIMVTSAATGSTGLLCKNNILTGNSGYGLNFGAATTPDTSFDGNWYYNNTSGSRNNCGTGTLDVTGTGTPFVNVSVSGGVLNNTNFALNTNAGGGASARAAGSPTTWGTASTTGYPDFGAVQSSDQTTYTVTPGITDLGDIKQSSTERKLEVYMGATGLTVAVTISKAGGAFASAAGTVSEIGGGWYAVAANATDTNTLGGLIVQGTSGSVVGQSFGVIVAYDQQSTTLGIPSLPSAAPNAAGGLLTYGSSTGQLNPSSGTFTGVGLATTQTGVTIPTVTQVTDAVVLPTGTGSGQISLSSGAVLLQPTQDFNNTGQTNALAANVTEIDGQSATASGSVAFPSTISSFAGGAVASVTGAVGSVTATVNANVTEIDGQAATASGTVSFPSAIGTSTYSGGAVASVTGNVGGNVEGNVAGSVNSVTEGVTVATNDDKTGYSLSSTQDFNNTGQTTPLPTTATDPWGVDLPGSYTAGEAGYIVGTNLDTNVGSRSTVATIWDALTGGMTTSGSIGKLLATLQFDVSGYIYSNVQTGATAVRQAWLKLTNYTAAYPSSTESELTITDPITSDTFTATQEFNENGQLTEQSVEGG